MDERCRVSRTATTCRKCHSVQKRLNKAMKYLSCCGYHISGFAYCNTFASHHLECNGYQVPWGCLFPFPRSLMHFEIFQSHKKAGAEFGMMNALLRLLNYNFSFHYFSTQLIYLVLRQPIYPLQSRLGQFRHFHILLHRQMSIFSLLKICFVSCCKKGCQFGPYIVKRCIV